MRRLAAWPPSAIRVASVARLASPIWIAGVVAALGAIPLAGLQLPASSDGLFHLYRVWELDRLWQQGVWLPDWAPDFYYGYGYPIFRYTPLLPYLLVELVHLLGVTLPGAFRVLLAFGLPASALAAYGCARQLLSPWAALVAAVAYALAPYHLVNLYGRTDLPEYLAAIWFPLLLWCVFAAARSPTASRRGPMLLLAVSTAGLLLTHNLSALMFAPFGAIFALVALTGAGVRWHAALATLAGGALLGAAASAFFWLPALHDRTLVQFGRLLHSYGFSAHFARPAALLGWGPIQQYAPVFPFAHRYGYPFALWQSLAVIGCIVVLPLLWRRLDGQPRILLAAAPPLVLGALLLTTAVSAPVWQHVPLLGLAQFPWRFLGIAALPSALCAGAVAEALAAIRPKAAPGLALALVAVIAVASLADLRPLDLRLPADALTPAGYARFELQERLIGTSAAGEYLPASVHVRAETSAAAFALATGERTPTGPLLPLVHLRHVGIERRYAVSLAAPTSMLLDSLAFSGWSVEVDGAPTRATADLRSGLLRVTLPAGRHTLAVVERPTRLQRAATMVSVAAGFLLLVLVGSLVLRWHPVPTWHAARTSACAAAGLFLLAILTGRARHDPAALAGARFSGGNEIVSAFSPNDARPVSPPASVSVTLTLRSVTPVAPLLQLVASDDLVWAEATGATQAPGRGFARLMLPIPAGTPPGVYSLDVGLLHAGRALRLASLDAVPSLPLGVTRVPLGAVVVRRGVPMSDGPATLQFPHAVTLGSPAFAVQTDGGQPATAATSRALQSGGEEIGTSCPSRGGTPSLCFSAGQAIQVALPWYDDGAHGHRVSVALHLVDASDTLWAAVDSEPAAGRFPATFWRPGERVLDRMELPIPSFVPPGTYRLAVVVSLDGRAVGAEDASGKPLGIEPTIAEVTLAAATHDVTFLTVIPPVPPAVDRNAGFGVTLRGARVPSQQARPGDRVQVLTLWAANGVVAAGVSGRVPAAAGIGGSSGPNLTLTIALVAADGHATTVYDGPPVAHDPASSWPVGVGILSQLVVRVPATISPGRDRVVVSLHAGASAGPAWEIGTLDIVAAAPGPTVQPANRLDARFGDRLRLVGFDPALPLRWTAGQQGVVTLYWQAVRPVATAYTVSLQLLNASGKLVAQDDSQPAGGAQPTTGWLPGVPVVDRRMVSVPLLPVGTYRLAVVVYNSATGQRLRLAGGADALPLAPIEIAG